MERISTLGRLSMEAKVAGRTFSRRKVFSQFRRYPYFASLLAEPSPLRPSMTRGSGKNKRTLALELRFRHPAWA